MQQQKHKAGRCFGMFSSLVPGQDHQCKSWFMPTYTVLKVLQWSRAVYFKALQLEQLSWRPLLDSLAVAVEKKPVPFKFPRPQTDFSPLHFTLNFCAQPGARGGFISAKTLFTLNAGYPYHFAFKQYSFPDIYLVASCQLAWNYLDMQMRFKGE